MTTTRIDYQTRPDFDHKGRNGFMAACGIEVLAMGDVVLLQPVNSRGPSDAARLAIPRADVPALIDALQPAPFDHWQNDPKYLYLDWCHEVANNDTRLGYHAWVQSQRERDGDD